MPNAHPVPFILVVQSSPARARQIEADARTAYPSAKLGHASDLSEAYNLSEHAHPDLVLLDPMHTEVSGLPMFLSLLSALAIDWTMVTHTHPVDAVPLTRQVRLDRLRKFLSDKWSFRAASPGRTATSRPVSKALPRPTGAPQRWKTVVMGASTGGIEALIAVLSRFPANAPPTVIVQHINGAFLSGLADRLDRLCAARVRVARNNDALKPGQILIAPGETAHLLVAQNGRRCQLETGPPRNGHRPAVDMLFHSAAQAIGADCVGVLLSGMGRDGAAGLLDIRNRGGWTIAQDQESCTVYGMPRAAVDAGAVVEELPLSSISQAVLKAASQPKRNLHNA